MTLMISKVISPTLAFTVVSFCIGQLGDGLNIFQGIYLVNIGWNEGAIGIALSLMGLTALLVQTYAGDFIDKTSMDRRVILTVASFSVAASAMTILLVREGNTDHMLMYVTKVLEGFSSSFIKPCLAALTLASFGPQQFDEIMASNVFWGHVGSSTSALMAGSIAYIFYPNIKSCFYVISFSVCVAILFVPFLPQGDHLMGRGMRRSKQGGGSTSPHVKENVEHPPRGGGDAHVLAIASNQDDQAVAAASYFTVLSEPKTLILCLTGFFFHFANANVLLVLGELMGNSQADNGNGDDGAAAQDDDAAPSRSAIPLIAGAILLAQATMSAVTVIGQHMTRKGVGRKALFLTGLISLPIRCALIIYWKDAGDGFLLSTQILDGIGGGFFELLHTFIVADVTFGTGRFNLIIGLTASSFGFGATLSNFLGQMTVEKMGHTASLSASLAISIIPIAIFALFMPETSNTREEYRNDNASGSNKSGPEYVELT